MADKAAPIVDSIGVPASNSLTAAGLFAWLVGVLASVNWGVVFGVLIALAGLLVNIYFHRKNYQLRKRESDARIKALEASCGIAIREETP